MAHKIKILHVIKSLGRGGAEVLLPETLKLHDKNTFEFHYIYFLPWKDQMVSEIESSGGRVQCFNANNNLKLLSQVNGVINYCKVNKIDIIHSHLPWSGFLGRIIHWKSKIPMIYTEHNIQERYHVLTKILNKLTFNFQSLALGVSNDVTRSINENIAPKIPVQTLLNGVNTSCFKRDLEKRAGIREFYKIPENAIVIGNIAVFRRQKCIPDWLKAFKNISSDNPNVYGLLVGAGPEEDIVMTMIKELELVDKIILPGIQTDTVPFFSAMDVFLMSSAFEGLPIALLEAMSMECAIVSTKAGGVVEVIREDQDGLLCNVGDWENLAFKVIDLIKTPDKLNNFQKAARRRVELSFSLVNMVNSLESIYLKDYSI
jgi:L-malate glycosyltransferase